jgi:nucleolar pre-ribosomal-associated protein 1
MTPKPLIINRFIQSIIQHPQFFRVVGVSSPCREGISELLHVLFHIHPWNACQPSHIQPLVPIYHGTLSSSDRRLLDIFKLFEIHRKTSVVGLLERWSSTTSSSSNALEALLALDSIQTLRTSLSYPRWRRLSTQTEKHSGQLDAQLYDPVFILLLFSTMLSSHVPDSTFSWIELFRTNVVGVIIRSLSSKDSKIREVAMVQISGLWQCLEVGLLV